MAERIIVKIGEPILREVCKPVKEITPNILKLLDDMAQTLYAGPNRAGLAAPQVGVAKRLVVLDCGDGLIELINPKIIKSSGKQTGPEGCLSLPGLQGNVQRANYVKVETLDRTGKLINLEGKGMLARCFQHEIEHLDGVLYIDHVEPGQLINDQTGEEVDLFQVIKLSKPDI